MSQCSPGKRWFTVTALFLSGAFSLTGCSYATLERLATERQEEIAGASSPSTASYNKNEILIPEGVIKGGQRNFTGVGGRFARLLVGPGEEVRFLKPVAVGGANNILYIVDAGQRIVFLYDLVTKKIDSLDNIGVQFMGEPGNIHVKKDGTFLITDPVGKKVFYFDEKGMLLNTFADPANLSRPVDVWVDENTQDVYVADGSYSHILLFNQFGQSVRIIGRRGTGPGSFRAITDMAVGRDGIYVLDRLELPIQVINKDGMFQYSFGESQHTFPTSITVDRNQMVFVSEKSDNTIKVYENGELISSVGGTGAAPGRFREVASLWANEGFLYVADSHNRRVQVFRINAPGSLAVPLGM